MNPRLLLLMLAACTWLPESGDEERLDRDGDGIPVLFDCADTNPARSRLDEEPLGMTITCDEEEEIEYDGATMNFGVSQCLNPTESEVLLEYFGGEHVYRIASETPVFVDAVVTRDSGVSVALVGNQGPICSREACVPGLPSVAEGDDTRELRVQGAAGPGDPFYVIVSFVLPEIQPYSLTVNCTP